MKAKHITAAVITAAIALAIAPAAASAQVAATPANFTNAQYNVTVVLENADDVEAITPCLAGICGHKMHSPVSVIKNTHVTVLADCSGAQTDCDKDIWTCTDNSHQHLADCSGVENSKRNAEKAAGARGEKFTPLADCSGVK